jgi:hypothetical protein
VHSPSLIVVLQGVRAANVRAANSAGENAMANHEPTSSGMGNVIGETGTVASGTGLSDLKPQIAHTDLRPQLVPRHGDYDWLILSQSRIGKSSGATRIWMLLATPG